MRPRVSLLAAALAAVALAIPAQAVASAADAAAGSGAIPGADSGGRAPSPRADLLDRAGHGEAVVRALGDRLPTAAATNRMSATRLREILRSDPTAWVGPDGQLFYKEPAALLTAATASTLPALATYPESQTFALHSLPGSAHTIYLDFDGAYVANTWWNVKAGMPSQAYSGFTLDASPAFSSAELAYIQAVWRIVAEKYAPFDVDVTTQDPGPDGYNRNGLLDLTYGDHVVITDDPTAVNSACGGSCSGIALLSTFDDTWPADDYYEPAWVFSSKTSRSAILTAHTVAHEVGHTFGLNHDGDATHTYYSGQGNWFPLMGSSALAIGQFSKGEYAGANNTEDDLAIIATHGAPWRLDDHSDLLLTAEQLAPGSVVGGVIGTRYDQDVFAIDHACVGALTASATGVGAGQSLDISLSLLAPDGTVIASADPASGQVTSSWPYVPTGVNASATVSAANARYYVRVDGVGKGDPSTGYSDYASIGQYQLAVSNCDGTMPVVTALPVPTTTTTPTTTTARTPSAPGIGSASSGRRGRPITATARWSAPASNGGAAITGYRVFALRLDSTGRVVKTLRSVMLSASSRASTLRLAKGRYRFQVVAYNAAGSASPSSAASKIVRAR